MEMNCSCGLVVRLTGERHISFFLAKTTVRDLHHREFPECSKQAMNLVKTRVKALLNEIVQYR